MLLALGMATRPGRRWVLLCVPFLLGHLAITRTRGALLALAASAIVVIVALVIARRAQSPSRTIGLTFAVMLAVAAVGIAAAATFTKASTGYPTRAGSV